MIIYGSRMYGKKNIKDSWGACQHCGNYAKNSSYDGRKFGHLYFIPLIPCEKPSRVIMECSSCDMGQHIEQTKLPELIKVLKETCTEALDHLKKGQNDFTSEGEEITADAYIINNIEMLTALNGEGFIESLLTQSRQHKLSPLTELIEAGVQECTGQPQQASQLYRETFQRHPESNTASVALGEHMLNHGQAGDALPHFEGMHQKDPQDFWALQNLLNIHTALKHLDKIPEIYEKMTKILPELKQDKKFVKQYKKACKKAKVETRF